MRVPGATYDMVGLSRDHREAMNKLSAQIGSGERVRRTSDDPSAARELQGLEVSLVRNERYEKNVSQAKHLLGTTASVLNSLTNILQRAQEIAVQFSSDMYGGEEFSAAAAEMESLTDEARRLANTRVGDRYIFGGASTTQPVTGGGAFVGDDTPFELEVTDGVTVQATIDGTDIFGTANLLGVLNDLTTALQSESSSSVETAITGVQTAFGAVVSSHSFAGAKISELDHRSELVQDSKVAISERAHFINGVDLPSAAAELGERQLALQALFAAVSNNQKLSLMNYLNF